MPSFGLSWAVPQPSPVCTSGWRIPTCFEGEIRITYYFCSEKLVIDRCYLLLDVLPGRKKYDRIADFYDIATILERFLAARSRCIRWHVATDIARINVARLEIKLRLRPARGRIRNEMLQPELRRGWFVGVE